MAEQPTASDFEPLPAGPWAAQTTTDVLEVAGPDAVSYLQGQLSQDVAGLAVGSWTPTLVLEPQGKMCAWLRMHRASDDAFELVVDAGYGRVVEERLRRFWLRTKAELTVRVDVPTLAVRGWPTERPLPSSDELTGNASPEQQVLVAPVDWPDHGGFDVVGNAPVPDGVGVVEGDAGGAALRLARVEAGIPAMGSEIGPDTIPAAAGVVDASVSFTKGCYTGQELVVRIHSRGNKTPNRLVRLSGDGDVPEAGTALTLEAKDRATVTTAVGADSDDAWVGLGYLHRSVETPADLDGPSATTVSVSAIERLAPQAE